jgi:hypothetical protein
MAIVFSNAGEVAALKNIVNYTAPETLVLRLFTNNRIPAKTDETADYTQLTGYGYSQVTLTPGNFVFTPGDPSTAAYPQITFTFSGAAGFIYGYFVVTASTNQLVFANRFTNSPIQIANAGDEIRITVTLTLNNP